MAAIRFDGVSKRYANGVLALTDVSWDVKAGEIAILAGPNGSGKTTALEMLSGLRSPTLGKVLLGGFEAKPYGPQRAMAGFQLQGAGLPTRIKVREAIKTVSVLYQDPGPVQQLVKTLGLDQYLNTMVEKLSGGWQRRLDVLLAVIGKPRHLVLDEPTSGLDPVARAGLWGFLRGLRKSGIAILVSTHDLSEAQSYADKLLVLHRGRLVLEGTVEEVLMAAGGSWRLRLTDADARADALIAESKLKTLRLTDGLLGIGAQEEVLSTCRRLENACHAGEIAYNDLIRGPVHLDDVFFTVVKQPDGPCVKAGA